MQVLARSSSSSKISKMKRAALAMAVSATLVFASAAQACDTCDAPGACDAYSCGGSSGKPTNCLFKTLDAFAGSIEKLMGFDKCKSSGCDSLGCDGCDSAMLYDLSTPIPPAYSPGVTYETQPRIISPAPRGVPAMPAPIHDPAPRMAPRTVPRMAPRTAPRAVPRMVPNSVPRVVPDSAPRVPSSPMPMESAPIEDSSVAPREPAVVAPIEQPFQDLPTQMERDQFDDYNAVPEASDPQPITDVSESASGPIPEPIPEPNAERPVDPTPPNETPDSVTPLKKESDGGSLFDTLDDPFQDDNDEATLPSPYRTIRPSKYRSSDQPNGFMLNSPQARRTYPTQNQQVQSQGMQGRPQPRVGSLPYTKNPSPRAQSVNAQRRMMANQNSVARGNGTNHAYRNVSTQAPNRSNRVVSAQRPSSSRQAEARTHVTKAARPSTSARQVSHDMNQRRAVSTARYPSPATYNQNVHRSNARSSQLQRYQQTAQPHLRPAPRSQSTGQRHSNTIYR